mmetsp:Transcript_42595/g.110037  ORF Transcript_42595/g.110037 Transcript_42595/m.110037 type:complete len:291 (+) Transcript_42595:678-1550(+)
MLEGCRHALLQGQELVSRLQLAARQVRGQLDHARGLAGVQALHHDLEPGEIGVLSAHLDHLGELRLLLRILRNGEGDGLQDTAEGGQRITELSTGGELVGLLDTFQNHRVREEDHRCDHVLTLGVALRQQRPEQGRGLRQARQRAARGPVGLLEERLQRVRVDDAEAALQQPEGLLELAGGHQIRGQLSLAQPLGLDGLAHGDVRALSVHDRHLLDGEVRPEVEVHVVAPRRTRASHGVGAAEVHVVVVAPAAGALARVLGRLVRIHEAWLRRGLRRLEGALREDLLGGL